MITRQLKSNIHITKDNSRETIICTATGDRLARVCQFAISHSLSGLEFAAGIPGTIGGAIMMNAGTQSGDMAKIIESIEILDKETLLFKTIERKDLDFSYRQLNISGIIVEAKLSLKQKNRKHIEQIFKQTLNQKKATQPLTFASAGCFFKNPDSGKSAGELIEKSGLKGIKIKDAMVSKTHANFIVNTNKASCNDILLLKHKIQKTVFKKFNIKLKTEVRMEGE